MKNVFPVISVIIPVYNTKKEYLRECFESIEKQTLRDFDVIVVDDGSKPKTAKYLDSFTRRDGWRVIHQKNQGASVAKQNGFDNSTGKYVLFLDADDIFMPNFFEKMFNTAKQNNSDVVMCWFNQFDSNTGKNVPNDYWTEGALSRLKNPLKYNYHDLPDEIFQTATTNLWTKLLRRDMLVDNGVRFDNGLPAANDFPSVLALLISAKIISAIPDRLIKYHVNNPESTTAMHRTKGSLSSFMAARASKKFLDDHNIYEEVKGSFTEIAIGVMCWNLRDNIPEFRKEYANIRKFVLSLDQETLQKMNWRIINNIIKNKTAREYYADSPLVSIIIPVYNVEKYLNECVDSVLNQTYKNLEIILVDDKSPDSSGRIADDYAKNDKRVKVIHKLKNGGLNMARATGFSESSGQFIMFVDSDDLLRNDCVKISVQRLLNDKTDFIRFGMIDFKNDRDLKQKLSNISDSIEPHILRGKKKLYMTQFNPGIVLQGMNQINLTMCVWGALYTRSLVDKINWKDTNYRVYEDNIWTLKLLENASSGTFIDYAGYFYRYGDSLSNSSALHNHLTGNSFNGKPIGYLEYLDYMFNEYRRYNKKYRIGADQTVEGLIRYLYIYRANQLTKANLWGVEHNANYINQVLKAYQETLELTQNDNKAKASRIVALEAENARINIALVATRNELNSHLSIKRSTKLTIGNIKRRIQRFHYRKARHE